MSDLLSSFIVFFAVIDPFGTIPVFIAVTNKCSESDRKKIAFKAIFVSTAVLLFFIIVGEVLLDGMNIPIPAFQIAGGIVLFLFALTMIFGPSKPEEEVEMVKKRHEKAIFPLAIPSIASPGAMLAAVLLTENNKNSLWEQAQTTLTMVAVLLIVLVFMLLSNKFFKYIGDGGASIISRVMGLILSSVAVANVLEGIAVYFQINSVVL